MRGGRRRSSWSRAHRRWNAGRERGAVIPGAAMWAGLIRRGSDPGSSRGEKSSTHRGRECDKTRAVAGIGCCAKQTYSREPEAVRVVRKLLQGPRGANAWPKPGDTRESSRHGRTQREGDGRKEAVETSRLLRMVDGGLPTPKWKQPFNECLLHARPWTRPLR